MVVGKPTMNKGFKNHIQNAKVLHPKPHRWLKNSSGLDVSPPHNRTSYF